MSASVSSNNFKGFVELDEEDRGKIMEYEPLPYAFRIPDKLNQIGETPILSPPQWLLLDHTIAVIWSLFTTFAPGNALDIDDLKWAREFLKDVRNAKGDHPPDVKTCLTEIENRLIALYAQLTPGKGGEDKVAVSVEETIRERKVQSIEPKRKEMSDKPNNKTFITDTVKPNSTCGRKQLKAPGVKEIKKSYVIQQKNMNGISKKSPSPNRKSEIPRKDNKKEEENFREVFQRNRTSDRISGMQKNTKKKNVRVEEGLNNDGSEVDIKIRKGDFSQIQVHDPKKISLQFKSWVSEEEVNNEQAYRYLKNEIRSLMKNPRIPKEEVLHFLKRWREEQVERFQNELKRLNSIEEFMKSVKMEGFVPYLPEDLTVKLESIGCKK